MYYWLRYSIFYSLNTTYMQPSFESQAFNTIIHTNTILREQYERLSCQLSEFLQKNNPKTSLMQQLFTQMEQQVHNKHEKILIDKLLDSQSECEQMEELIRIQNSYVELIKELQGAITIKQVNEAEKWYRNWGYFQTKYEKLKVKFSNLCQHKSRSRELSILFRILSEKFKQEKIMRFYEYKYPQLQHRQQNTSQSSVAINMKQLSVLSSDYLLVYRHYYDKIQQESRIHQELTVKYHNYRKIYEVVEEQYQKSLSKYLEVWEGGEMKKKWDQLEESFDFNDDKQNREETMKVKLESVSNKKTT